MWFCLCCSVVVAKILTHRWSAPQWTKQRTQAEVLQHCEAHSVHGDEGITTVSSSD